MDSNEEIRYISPADPERVRQLREDARRRWAALTEEQREERRKAAAARKEALRASPRRFVRRTRAENGDLVLERADGARVVIRRRQPAAETAPANG